MENKKNPIIPYLIGILLLVGVIFYGVYYKVSGNLEFQASLQSIAQEVQQNKTLASEGIAVAIQGHQDFMRTVQGDFDQFYIREFQKNEFVRTFDTLIEEISSNVAPLVVSSLNISSPISSVDGSVESIPISITLTTNKDSLLALVQRLESVGLDRTNPFYLMELQSLNFQVPTNQETDQLPEITTTLNFNISKTISSND